MEPFRPNHEATLIKQEPWREFLPPLTPGTKSITKHHQCLTHSGRPGTPVTTPTTTKNFISVHASLSSFFSNAHETLPSRHRPPSLLQYTAAQLACR
ncbi:hypothetical protein DEO72_LG2g2874 [Vigna unguiculata]|uniref:Uncharacterized protein n=1 Tax=Vigna unguiculata TaxID=3917 RepID=A0A4D6L252_VIGUN|nr:hypothetical protein DEO72_LG2g2872 [Vigna unguiculata]QCD82534.1 hypothetical protein DEO72_LG2g2874 [Vigna unguiculata]